jgi:hypothetical protein
VAILHIHGIESHDFFIIAELLLFFAYMGPLDWKVVLKINVSWYRVGT